MTYPYGLQHSSKGGKNLGGLPRKVKKNSLSKDWSLLELSPYVWLNAASPISNTTIGVISGWNDISGNNRHYISATNKPVSAENVCNSMPAIAFNGANSCAATAPVINFETGWAFYVIRPTQTAKVCAEANSGTCQGATSPGQMVYANQPGIAEYAGINALGSYRHSAGVISSLLTYSIALTDFNILSFRYVNRSPSVYVNGTFGKTGLTSSIALSRALTLGVGTYGSFVGDIAEHAIFTFDLTDTQRMFVEGDMAHRWALNTRFNDTHLFKYSKPKIFS